MKLCLRATASDAFGKSFAPSKPTGREQLSNVRMAATFRIYKFFFSEASV
jgi:hypothetical protein